MQVSDRREFLKLCSAAAAAACVPGAASGMEAESRLATRGVVLIAEDLSLASWPQRAKDAGLTTIAIHHQHSPAAVVEWAGSANGMRFHEQCRSLQLHIEYELHAMQELLPRKLFATRPELFRMDDSGQRTPDANCCVHSAAALDLIGENAVRLAEVLRPTTGRYFYWGDDGQPWCRCSKCRELTPSDQAVTVENHLLQALRQVDSRAQVAHLAYVNTLPPPANVRPAAGVFLEYAPIHRRYDVPYSEQTEPNAADGLQALDANLQVFPRQTAQVLEYWLDVSRFSRWRRPARQLPWNKDVLETDIATYRAYGIQHVTSFAVWVDAEYQKRFGEPGFIEEYGAALRG